MKFNLREKIPNCGFSARKFCFCSWFLESDFFFEIIIPYALSDGGIRFPICAKKVSGCSLSLDLPNFLTILFLKVSFKLILSLELTNKNYEMYVNQAGLASRRIPGQRDRPGTERDSCPECRDSLSRGILVAGLSRRFLSRSRLFCEIESRSRSQSQGFAGPGPGSRRIPGQPPIPGWDLENLRNENKIKKS